MALGTAGTLTTATCGRHFWRLWCSESLKMCTLKAPQSRSVEKRGSNPSNWSQVLAFSRECHGIHIDTRYTVFCFRRYRPCTPLRFTYLQASAHVKGCPTSADMGFKRTPPAPNLLCESSWALNDPMHLKSNWARFDPVPDLEQKYRARQNFQKHLRRHPPPAGDSCGVYNINNYMFLY